MHSGYAHYPNIYFGQQHIGGFDDLYSHLACDKAAMRVINDNGIPTTSSEEGNPFESHSDIERFERINDPHPDQE